MKLSSGNVIDKAESCDRPFLLGEISDHGHFMLSAEKEELWYYADLDSPEVKVFVTGIYG